MTVELGNLMAEKVDISSLMESLSPLESPCAYRGTDNEECKDIRSQLGELLMEHGRHLIEYVEKSATTDAEKGRETGEFFMNWGSYLVRISRGNVKFTPSRPEIADPAKCTSIDHLGCREKWARLYNLFEH